MPRKELVESLVKQSLKTNEKGELVLDLTKTGITKDDLKFVLSGLKSYQTSNPQSPPLRQLLLRGINLEGSTEGIIALVTSGAKELRYLDVNGCNLDSRDLLRLTNLLQSTKISAININGNRLKEESFSTFKEYLAQTNLTEVKMPGKCERIEKEVLAICQENRDKSRVAITMRKDDDGQAVKRLAVQSTANESTV
jgi:hypothetical protein